MYTVKSDDTIDVVLKWNNAGLGVGTDWIYWSSTMKGYPRFIPGQRASGGWCFAVPELMKLHYQRPALI